MADRDPGLFAWSASEWCSKALFRNPRSFPCRNCHRVPLPQSQLRDERHKFQRRRRRSRYSSRHLCRIFVHRRKARRERHPSSCPTNSTAWIWDWGIGKTWASVSPLRFAHELKRPEWRGWGWEWETQKVASATKFSFCIGFEFSQTNCFIRFKQIETTQL